MNTQITQPPLLKIAITGGTGFVGRHLAHYLTTRGHSVVLIARGKDHRDPTVFQLPSAVFKAIGTSDETALTDAFQGCAAVAHCAGINREIGSQTYEQVHLQGTDNVIRAARKAGVQKIALLSFLRARPDCGSGYHESKWAAEERIRASGLDYTILKAGVIYGAGDHMLDHLSHAFHTFPIFGLVGFGAPRLQPLAVNDLVRVLEASLIEGRLSRQTVAVMGPESLTLEEAVRRVARVVGKSPLMIRLPIFLHALFAGVFEISMKTPLLARAQLQILQEGIVEPLPYADRLPDDLLPQTAFTEESIRQGLPPPKGFRLSDLKGFN